MANYQAWPAVPRFALATLALAGLAWVVSFATEQLGERFGPGVTGMLQSTLGNLPELFVVIFALQKGELVVAQTAIVGSILANALLVLGLVIVVGARRSPDGIMRFSKRLPRDTATLLQVTVFIIVLLGLSLASHDPASHHVKAISAVGAVCLLVVYLAWVVPYLRSDVAPGSEAEERAAASAERRPRARCVRSQPRRARGSAGELGGGAARLGLARGLSLALTLALLIVAGTASAFVSDWFVNGLEPAISILHISQAFAGLVIVAIAGNAVENTAGLVLAYKGRSDLAISVVKNSVAQIAAFLFPLLVLVSFALSHHADVRARARLHRRAGAHGAGAVAGDRRRRGGRIRGLGAGRAVRDPRDADAVRVARARSLTQRPSPPISAPAMPPVAAALAFESTPSSGAMNSVWIARRPGPVKRFQVSLPPPPNMPVFRPIVTASSLTVGSLYSHAPASTSSCSPSSRLHEEHVAMPVQPHQRVAVGRAELVHEEARAAEHHVLHALDPFEAVVEVVGGRDELVLAHVQAFALARCSGTHWPGESREKAIRP